MSATTLAALTASTCIARPLTVVRLLPTTVALSSLRCAIIRAKMRSI